MCILYLLTWQILSTPYRTKAGLSILYLTMSQKRRVGIAICGFGRAGQIHFHGVRKNPRGKLLYVVDLVEDDTVRSRIEAKLEEFVMEGVAVVGKKCFEEVMK